MSPSPALGSPHLPRVCSSLYLHLPSIAHGIPGLCLPVSISCPPVSNFCLPISSPRLFLPGHRAPWAGTPRARLGLNSSLLELSGKRQNRPRCNLWPLAPTGVHSGEQGTGSHGREPGGAPEHGVGLRTPLASAAERVTSLGKDWHRPCLKCEKCGKTLTSGGHAEVRCCREGTGCKGRAGVASPPTLSLQHEGKPYCNHPCYSAMFGPKGRLPSTPLPSPRVRPTRR